MQPRTRAERLRAINHEIRLLKSLMIRSRTYVESFSDPLIVAISQLLDKKLNQRDRLLNKPITFK